MIALLLAAAILAGPQGPARAPAREAHATAMRALARAAIERDPEFNRAGQEALQRARSASIDERERRLNDVIATHGDAWCEDGTQVGATARALLAVHLAGLDRYDEAERIALEMVKLFPGAIDETGATLDDLPHAIRLLRVPKDEPRSARLMSRIGERLRTVLCCAVLQAGAFAGVPMRPEQIRDLMQGLNQPKVAQTNPDQDQSGRRV